MDLERDGANFHGTVSSILYFQGLSTIPCVTPVFAKRGDIVVANQVINCYPEDFAIYQRTVRWFDHNDLKDLEDVPHSAEKE